jgi:hypothetical protein
VKKNGKKIKRAMDVVDDDLAPLIDLGMIAFNEGFILGQLNPTQNIDMSKFKIKLTELIKEKVENEKAD